MIESIIFCDGSSSPKIKTGGWASLVAIESGDSFLLQGSESDTTNNRMELTAALKGLEFLASPHYVYLVSDSAYLINTLKNKWYDKWDLKEATRKNADLWEKLIERVNFHTVYPLHVKGHADSEYNNRVDQIAVVARKEQSPEKIEQLNVSFSKAVGE